MPIFAASEKSKMEQNRILKFMIFYFIVLLFNKSVAQIDDTLYHCLKRHLEMGINYLVHTQIKQDKDTPQVVLKGEWPTWMCMERAFILLGGKRKVYDSNCFSVASIHNALASIYLLYPEYKQILPSLDLAYNRILGYKNGRHFNFWNALPPYRKLKKGDIKGQQSLVRRPTNFRLKSKYINKAANVTEDADDTAMSYIAMVLRRKILNHDSINQQDAFLSYPISSIFDRYRDSGRHNRHWYNYLYDDPNETGAYLTWLGMEYQFKRWHKIWGILKFIPHNFAFFAPFSECYPHAYVPYIPYGANDLDGVVNANVLSALAIYNEKDIAKGYRASVRWLSKKCEEQIYDYVGVYYPNRYQFPYAISEAYYNGVKDLEPSIQYVINYIIKNQKSDGSWVSRRSINKGDRFQSTVYAVSALINFGNYDKYQTKLCIQKALIYILKHAIYDQNGVHWNGGVFFSGGTVVRKALLWKSDAYTTAIILKSFARYLKHLEESSQRIIMTK